MGALALLAIATGLFGQVRVGPTTPVCVAGQPCDRPAQVTLVFNRPGHKYRVATKMTGAYRIALPAGVYVVSTVQRIGMYPNISPRTARVTTSGFRHVDFSIDTGIR